MNIREQRHGAVTVLAPVGPLVQEDGKTLVGRASRALEKSLGRIVIDASGVPFVDSAGLEALVEVAEQLSKRGQMLRLCGANETLREVIDLTDLGSRFEYYEDAGDAARSFL